MPAEFLDVGRIQAEAPLGTAVAAMRALVKTVAHELRPELGVDDQLRLIVIEILAIAAKQALGKVLDLERYPALARTGDGIAQLGKNIEMRCDQILVVILAHWPVVPEIHAFQTLQVPYPLNQRR